MFIDVEALEDLHFNEPIPVCFLCGKTTEWKVGAHQLDRFSEQRRRDYEKLESLRLHASITLQCFGRTMFAKHMMKRRRKEKLEWEARKLKASNIIKAACRGRLDRRRASTERCLRRIAAAHSIVLQEALRKKRGVKIFWYRKREHVKQLYSDYKLLVERTGYSPPLYLVERNIQLVYQNVHRVESERATIVQKMFRGMVGRRFMKEYRIEITWLFQRQLNSAFRIQICYRAHKARCSLEKLKIMKLRELTALDYYNYQQAKRQKEEEDGLKRKILYQYKESRKQTTTAAFIFPGLLSKEKLVVDTALYGTCEKLFKLTKATNQ